MPPNSRRKGNHQGAAAAGWRFDKRHSIDPLLDSPSNDKTRDTNEGLENVCMRYGHRF